MLSWKITTSLDGKASERDKRQLTWSYFTQEWGENSACSLGTRWPFSYSTTLFILQPKALGCRIKTVVEQMLSKRRSPNWKFTALVGIFHISGLLAFKNSTRKNWQVFVPNHLKTFSIGNYFLWDLYRRQLSQSTPPDFLYELVSPVKGSRD